MDKEQANVLLLSDESFEYQTLKNAGYKNVFWFKSILRAYEYFKAREEELEKFDIILMGSSSLTNIEDYKFKSIFYRAINGEKSVPYMCFFSSFYEKQDELKEFYISHPDLTRNGVSKEHFLSVLRDSIPEELRGEKIELPEIEEKKIELPKTRADVKVLFMGYLINEELVKQFFEEAGFTSYEFIRSGNFTLRDNVERFADYDLIVADLGFNGNLTSLGDEFQDYMKDKGKSIYLAVYNFDHKKDCLSHYYVKGLPTENPQNETFVEFDSVDDENNALKDIMGIVINMYTTYNKNIGDGGYPDKEELEAKYKRQSAELLEKNKKAFDNMEKVKYIRLMLAKYCRFYCKDQKFGRMLSNLNGLKVKELQDGASVAFLVENKEAVRITFNDNENTDNKGSCLHFHLEYLMENGKGMRSPIKRTCTSSYCADNAADYPSDEEMRKVNVVYNRIKQNLQPIIDKIDHMIGSNPTYYYGDKNKIYGKKYMV